MDARWTKVQVVLDLLQQRHEATLETASEGSGSTVGGEYVVWLDSDVVFLDMGLRLEAVVQRYPEHDFICSADSQVR